MTTERKVWGSRFVEIITRDDKGNVVDKKAIDTTEYPRGACIRPGDFSHSHYGGRYGGR